MSWTGLTALMRRNRGLPFLIGGALAAITGDVVAVVAVRPVVGIVGDLFVLDGLLGVDDGRRGDVRETVARNCRFG